MIEAMLIGLLLGVSCALLDHAAPSPNGEPAEEWEVFVRGLVVGSFMFGPPVILASCTSHTAHWLAAVIVTWTVLALSSREVWDWARR